MKRFVSVLLTAIILFTLIPFTAVDALADTYTDEQGLTYKLKSNGYSNYYAVTNFDRSVQDVVIPSEIDGIPVTTIENSAFRVYLESAAALVSEGADTNDSSSYYSREDLRSIVIPKSITFIGDYAFEYCEYLTSIVIPVSVTSIGYGAFSSCGLENVFCEAETQPESWRTDWLSNTDATVHWGAEFDITSIAPGKAAVLVYEYDETDESYTLTNCVGNGNNIIVPAKHDGYPIKKIKNNAFLNNYYIERIQIPDCVADIGEYAFYGCSNLTSINIPEGITAVRDATFSDCLSLTEIVLPESLLSIGIGAFSNSGLTSLAILDNVSSIENSAFNDCSLLTEITVSKNNPVYHSKDNCLIETKTSILLLGCKTSVIPEYVTSIGNSAFDGCTDLRSITIPDSVTTIGWDAFGGCSSLTNIVIPENVTYISSYAFSYCSSLTSIVIPDGVTDIDYRTFFCCTGLTSIIVSKDNPVFHSKDDCLIDTATNTLIMGCINSIIPDYVTAIAENAFDSCEYLTSIVIPESVTEIGNWAFSGCDNLSDIYCEAESQPAGWSEYWMSNCDATVHWGYTALKQGDVDGNGEIDQYDYLYVKRAYFDTYTLDEEEAKRADVDHSGSVDQIDYVLIKRAYFGTYTIK